MREQNALLEWEWDGPGHVHFFAEIPYKHLVKGKGYPLLTQWVHLHTNLVSGQKGSWKRNEREKKSIYHQNDLSKKWQKKSYVILK